MRDFDSLKYTNRDWIEGGRKLNLEAELSTRGIKTNPLQLALLDAIADDWVKCGLLPGGRNENLWACCPNASKCWKGLDGKHEPEGLRGGVTLPWIGPGYPESRVALMGLNLVRSGGLLDEVDITTDTISAFLDGRRAVWPGSRTFQHRSTAMLAAVLAAVEGRPIPTAPPDFTELVDALLRTARVQAIKCSPWGEGASPPSASMKRLCLGTFMPTEIGTLKPRVVVVVHSEARGRLWYAAGKPIWRDEPGLTVGNTTLGSHAFTVLGVTHPSDRNGGWQRSWERLVAYLEKHGDTLRTT